ncbi:MAG TPA: poly(R)-hydroxyalkanoic acid synthase subunit PhaE [Herpetosiphonaceae bacterium]
MTQRSDNSNPFDPFSAWREMRDATMDTWSKVMIEMVNSEAYAEATGRMMDSYLTASAPFRQVMESTMTQVLTQLNMPTRADVTSLAERLTNIEMRLDDLEAKLDTLERNTKQAARPAQSRAKGSAEES